MRFNTKRAQSYMWLFVKDLTMYLQTFEFQQKNTKIKNFIYKKDIFAMATMMHFI